MTRRFTSGAVLIAVLALFAGACSSDDSADETTTTEKAETTTTDESADESTDEESTDEVSDAEFEDQVAEVVAQIELAGTDSCALMDAMLGTGSTELPDPSSPEQVMTAMALLEVLTNAMSAAATPENAAAAETFSAAMATYADEALANEYDPEWFNDDETDPLTDGEAATAMQSYFEAAAVNCPTGTVTG